MNLTAPQLASARSASRLYRPYGMQNVAGIRRKQVANGEKEKKERLIIHPGRYDYQFMKKPFHSKAFSCVFYVMEHVVSGAERFWRCTESVFFVL